MRFTALAAALGLAALVIPSGMAGVAAQGVKTSEQGGVGSQPASVAEIVAATGDCFKFVKHHGQVNHEGLKAAGWLIAGKEDVKGSADMPANTTLFLGKGNVIMILRHTGLAATCQTIGKVDDIARTEEVRTGIGTELGAKPAKDYKGDDKFKAMLLSRLGPTALDTLMISDAARFTVIGSSKSDANVVSTIMVPRILD